MTSGGTVSADYQGGGIGRSIIEEILAKLPDCNVILYSSPGKEEFYRKQGFRKMKTGMALFSRISTVQEGGFTDEYRKKWVKSAVPENLTNDDIEFCLRG